MKIGFASDHAAFETKQLMMAYVKEKYGYEIVDYGTYNKDSCNYAEYGEKLGLGVVNKEVDLGIAICGTGVGISIACNKVKGIRAVCCSEAFSAKMARNHNNANVLAFGARVVGEEVAKTLIDAFFNNEFEGGRHTKRVEYISQIENR